MASSLCELTLVVPRRVEQLLVECLERQEEGAVTGYTLLHGQGHGSGLSPSSGAERVRGAAAVTMLVLVLPPPRAEDLLQAIRRELPVPHLAFWIKPVSDYGVLV